jgi:hypothetical protein
MPILITTSWDDGCAQDERLAGMLLERGLTGTFYVTTGHGDPQQAEIARRLHGLGVEVGAHTVSHRPLSSLDEDAVREELVLGRAWLEAVLGAEVRSFCFPHGRFRPSHRALVAAAGYRVARTTVGFRTEVPLDPLQLPVTVHLHRPRRRHVLTHAASEGNVGGLVRWLWKGRAAVDPEVLAARLLTGVDRGAFHLWGHAWEIDAAESWPLLARVLDGFAALVADGRAEVLTNGQLGARLTGGCTA